MATVFFASLWETPKWQGEQNAKPKQWRTWQEMDPYIGPNICSISMHGIDYIEQSRDFVRSPQFWDK